MITDHRGVPTRARRQGQSPLAWPRSDDLLQVDDQSSFLSFPHVIRHDYVADGNAVSSHVEIQRPTGIIPSTNPPEGIILHLTFQSYLPAPIALPRWLTKFHGTVIMPRT